MPMKRKDPVAEMLGTQNKKEQIAQIEQLANMASAPVLTLVVSFDSRTQRVDAKQVGAEAPNEILQQILDAAKNLFNQQEIAKQVKLAQQGDPSELPREEYEELSEEAVEKLAGDVSTVPPADPEGVPDAI